MSRPAPWHRLTCHCGAVELHLTLAPDALGTARRCDCSFCRRRGAVTATVSGDIELVKGAEALQLYQWGTGAARHYFCGICGIYTHHWRRTRDEYAVNLFAIEGMEPQDFGPFGWSNGTALPL
ncbi:GFA family protein [Pseudooceanicola aestuarii]|uniref:GFA family protein n=1 Tax=Pseudooceanicola aestuarii TaxID=2697319 RepID=UPI0013D29B2D|nr:GFA family protein [Pseudooceanicola aestuarii]